MPLYIKDMILSPRVLLRPAIASPPTGHDGARKRLQRRGARFDVTWTTRAGDKEWFRRNMSLADLTHTLPAMLESAPARQRNVIVPSALRPC